MKNSNLIIIIIIYILIQFTQIEISYAQCISNCGKVTATGIVTTIPAPAPAPAPATTPVPSAKSQIIPPPITGSTNGITSLPKASIPTIGLTTTSSPIAQITTPITTSSPITTEITTSTNGLTTSYSSEDQITTSNGQDESYVPTQIFTTPTAATAAISSQNKGIDTRVIIGSVIGGTGAIILIIGSLFAFKRCKPNKTSQVMLVPGADELSYREKSISNRISVSNYEKVEKIPVGIIVNSNNLDHKETNSRRIIDSNYENENLGNSTSKDLENAGTSAENVTNSTSIDFNYDQNIINFIQGLNLDFNIDQGDVGTSATNSHQEQNINFNHDREDLETNAENITNQEQEHSTSIEIPTENLTNFNQEQNVDFNNDQENVETSTKNITNPNQEQDIVNDTSTESFDYGQRVTQRNVSVFIRQLRQDLSK